MELNIVYLPIDKHLHGLIAYDTIQICVQPLVHIFSLIWFSLRDFSSDVILHLTNEVIMPVITDAVLVNLTLRRTCGPFVSVKWN